MKIVYLVLLLNIPEVLCGQKTRVFVDDRDKHSYKYIQIGHQYWMAENLAYLPNVSPPIVGVKLVEKQNDYCYVFGYFGNSISEAKATLNYKLYGVLYNWEMAKKACPFGWHLPSDEDFFVLEKQLGMSDSELEEFYYRNSGKVGYLLKSKSGWFEGGIGIDKFGFNALPGGFRHNGDLSKPDPQGGFGLLGEEATFWTSTSTSESTAIRRQFSYSSMGIVRFSNVKEHGYSVRCVK